MAGWKRKIIYEWEIAYLEKGIDDNGEEYEDIEDLEHFDTRKEAEARYAEIEKDVALYIVRHEYFPERDEGNRLDEKELKSK